MSVENPASNALNAQSDAVPAPWSACRIGLLGCTLGALASPGTARAALELVPYGSAQYEHHSNIFEVSSEEEALEQNGDSERSDNVLRLAAGLDLSWMPGQQELRLKGEARRLQYDRNGDLDHNEHTVSAAFDWKAGSTVDGTLEYEQDRRVASFADLDTSELSVQTERNAHALLGVGVTPTWRVETAANYHESELPLDDAPEFKLEETSGTLAINYLGVSKLSAGLLGEYLEGEYTGSDDARSFDETSLQLTADYAVTGLSSFNLKLGVTERQEERDDALAEEGTEDEDVSGFTGSLGYNRTLSGKTSFGAQIFRRVDSYVAGANALVDTGLQASLNWQPTARLSVGARAGWTRSEFENGSDTAQAGREDDLTTASLELSYQALRWLALRPFVEYRDRSSNIEDESFDSTVVGAEMRARFE